MPGKPGYRMPGSERGTRKDGTIPHGELSGYSRWGCRCDECRAFWREYRRPRVQAWRARKKAERADAD
jgi:hypothetical protein